MPRSAHAPGTERSRSRHVRRRTVGGLGAVRRPIAASGADRRVLQHVRQGSARAAPLVSCGVEPVRPRSEQRRRSPSTGLNALGSSHAGLQFHWRSGAAIATARHISRGFGSAYDRDHMARSRKPEAASRKPGSGGRRIVEQRLEELASSCGAVPRVTGPCAVEFCAGALPMRPIRTRGATSSQALVY